MKTMLNETGPDIMDISKWKSRLEKGLLRYFPHQKVEGVVFVHILFKYILMYTYLPLPISTIC